MIKKLLLMYWYEQKDSTQEHRTFKKSYARWRKHGLSGMKSRLEKEFVHLKADYSTYIEMDKKYVSFMTRMLFVCGFVLGVVYFMLLKVELYESKTAIIVKDLNSNANQGSLELTLLGAGTSSQFQDSKVVEEYLLSLDLFTLLDKKFSLSQHYKSKDLDIVQRLSSDSTVEEALEFYRQRIIINYDEASGILHIAYAHNIPDTAQNILKFLIHNVEQEFNEFNRRRARKQLKFIVAEHEKTKQQMDLAGDILEKYQNDHNLLDPKNDAMSSSSIISSLEASLIEKKIELSTLRGYLNEHNYEIIKLKNEIQGIKTSIKNQKDSLSGNAQTTLNKILFEYEKLRLQFEFSTEVYKTSLIQLETTRLDVLKEAKTLSVLSEPNLPDGYTYPNKPRVFITLLIVFLLVYGIYSMLITIIKDHKE